MLESYITPVLMSYVDKYIKNLKPSDLSLSLWGGDVVLYNLELRLDVLEKVRRTWKMVSFYYVCTLDCLKALGLINQVQGLYWENISPRS